jgi:hypothetical protein
MDNKTSKTAETKILDISDIRCNPDMVIEQFEYRGFTFQRMSKNAMWYVCYANQTKKPDS